MWARRGKKSAIFSAGHFTKTRIIWHVRKFFTLSVTRTNTDSVCCSIIKFPLTNLNPFGPSHSYPAHQIHRARMVRVLCVCVYRAYSEQNDKKIIREKSESTRTSRRGFFFFFMKTKNEIRVDINSNYLERNGKTRIKIIIIIIIVTRLVRALADHWTTRPHVGY